MSVPVFKKRCHRGIIDPRTPINPLTCEAIRVPRKHNLPSPPSFPPPPNITIQSDRLRGRRKVQYLGVTTKAHWVSKTCSYSPILIYGTLTWSSSRTSQIRRLNILQNRFLRMIFETPVFVNTTQIHTDLPFPTFNQNALELARKTLVGWRYRWWNIFGNWTHIGLCRTT